MNIKRAFYIINRAKMISNGNFALANVMFAVLLEDLFRTRQAESVNADDFEPILNKGAFEALVASIETKDLDGLNPREYKFDLLIISAKNDRFETLGSSSIPLCLIEPAAAFSAIKVEGQFENLRERTPAENEVGVPYETTSLWSEVLKEIPPEVLHDVVTKHLTIRALEKIATPVSDKSAMR